MGLSLILVKRFVCKHALCCVVVFIFGLGLPQAMAETQSAAGRVQLSIAVGSSEHDPLVDAAFDHFYNLDYDRAIQEFEKVLDRHPNDAFAVNHLLATILMRELYTMG